MPLVHNSSKTSNVNGALVLSLGPLCMSGEPFEPDRPPDTSAFLYPYRWAELENRLFIKICLPIHGLPCRLPCHFQVMHAYEWHSLAVSCGRLATKVSTTVDSSMGQWGVLTEARPGRLTCQGHEALNTRRVLHPAPEL